MSQWQDFIDLWGKAQVEKLAGVFLPSSASFWEADWSTAAVGLAALHLKKQKPSGGFKRYFED